MATSGTASTAASAGGVLSSETSWSLKVSKGGPRGT